MFLDEKSEKKKIEVVASNAQDRELPIIHENAGLEEIVKEMIRFGHSRILYVADDARRLLGTISLGNLTRTVFSTSYEPRIHPRRLMTAITMEKAGHMMQKHLVFARMEETIITVVRRMIKANVKELAILDEENRIIGDITMLDLLEYILEQKKP